MTEDYRADEANGHLHAADELQDLYRLEGVLTGLEKAMDDASRKLNRVNEEWSKVVDDCGQDMMAELRPEIEGRIAELRDALGDTA